MGSLNERNPSVWVASAPPGHEWPALGAADRPASVDVAVIGGGIAGLSTALALVEDGASVAVLEAGRICSGVTAHTTAKVTSLHGLVYAGLDKSFGETVARLYGEANEAAIRQVAAWVDTHGIECDFSRRAAYTYTTSTQTIDSIADEVAVAKRLGLPATLTTETELPFEIKAAVRFDDQAQFHPRLYCLGLADAIARLGGHLFEHTRATAIDEGSPCRVTTDGGELEAGQVVVATHLPFLDRGGFFAKTHPARSYAMAVRLRAKTPAPSGMYLSADQPTRSVRSALQDEVVILGGEGHKVGQDDDTRERYASLESWARENFDIEQVDQRWSAQDYMPADGLPFVGRQTSGSKVFVATGFKKWGMTNGTAAGIMLAAESGGRENPWGDAYDASRAKSSLTSRDFYKENANVAEQFLGDRLSTMRPPSVDSLEPGDGAIVSLDGDRVAAFRDDDGVVHAVSAVCTHLGCLVSFNTAERTWDCPCHGSRFTVDGEVIQGPATSDLEQKQPLGERMSSQP